MPDRPTPRLLRFYTEHQDSIDAAIGTVAWASLIAVLLFVGAL